MGLFRICKCGHIEEDHAMDAPDGEQECLAEGCDCEQFEEAEDAFVILEGMDKGGTG